ARVVDAGGLRAARGRWIVECGVGAAAQEEAVGAAGILVIADDLARAVDSLRKGAVGGRGIVERGVGAAAQEEAVGNTAGVDVIPDDLARVVDPLCKGALQGPRAGLRIVESRVAA